MPTIDELNAKILAQQAEINALRTKSTRETHKFSCGDVVFAIIDNKLTKATFVSEDDIGWCNIAPSTSLMLKCRNCNVIPAPENWESALSLASSKFEVIPSESLHALRSTSFRKPTKRPRASTEHPAFVQPPTPVKPQRASFAPPIGNIDDNLVL